MGILTASHTVITPKDETLIHLTTIVSIFLSYIFRVFLVLIAFLCEPPFPLSSSFSSCLRPLRLLFFSFFHFFFFLPPSFRAQTFLWSFESLRLTLQFLNSLRLFSYSLGSRRLCPRGLFRRFRLLWPPLETGLFWVNFSFSGIGRTSTAINTAFYFIW